MLRTVIDNLDDDGEEEEDGDDVIAGRRSLLSDSEFTSANDESRPA